VANSAPEVGCSASVQNAFPYPSLQKLKFNPALSKVVVVVVVVVAAAVVVIRKERKVVM
jgi:hypothetical protein